jgi:hypothetical protein
VSLDRVIVEEVLQTVVVQETAAGVIVRAPGPAAAVPYWGAFWDITNQVAANTTTAYALQIGQADPGNNGVSIASGSRITVANAGVYNVQFSIQFKNTDNDEREVDVWFSKNGVDIADSNSRFTIAKRRGAGNDGHLIGALNFIATLAAADYVEINWRVNNTAVSLETFAAGTSPTRPRIPSAIVTVARIA